MSEAHLWDDEGFGGENGENGVGEEDIEFEPEEDEALLDELEGDAESEDEPEEEQ